MAFLGTLCRTNCKSSYYFRFLPDEPTEIKDIENEVEDGSNKIEKTVEENWIIIVLAITSFIVIAIPLLFLIKWKRKYFGVCWAGTTMPSTMLHLFFSCLDAVYIL